MAKFPIVEEYVEKFVILNEIGQWESFRTEERIVRCRDCKHSWFNTVVEYDSEYTCHEIEQLFCTHPMTTEPSSLEVKPDGFCAWGKEKQNDSH